jgi:FkbM family methyltransferase
MIKVGYPQLRDFRDVRRVYGITGRFASLQSQCLEMDRVASPVRAIGARSDIDLALAPRYAAVGWAAILASQHASILESARSDRECCGGRTQIECNVPDRNPDYFFATLPNAPNTLGIAGKSHGIPADIVIASEAMATAYRCEVLCLRAGAPGHGGRCIISISSVARDRTQASILIYGPTKAGLTAFLSELRKFKFQWVVTMSTRRTIANLFERVIGARIVHALNIGPVFEEEHLRRFFRHFEVDCVFDVGANAGQYATMIRKRAGYRGPIISFEPNPQVAAKLREKARRDQNWFVEEVALGASAGQATFNIMSMDQMSSLRRSQTTETDIFRTDAKIVKKMRVKVSTLEIELGKYRPKLGFKCPFLKMDTQGHDVDVALGAGEKLSEFVGLQSELAIKRIYEDSPTLEDALRLYYEKGFVLSAFVPNNASNFPYLIETDCIMFRGK